MEEQGKSKQKKEILVDAEESNRIIKSLASDYAAIFTANLRTDEAHSIVMDDNFMNVLKKIDPETNPDRNYSDRMRITCETIVHPDDKASFKKLTDSKNLSKLMKDERIVMYEFRSKVGERIIHLLMKIVCYSKDDSDDVVFGIKNNESEFLAKKQNEEALSRSIKNYEMLHDMINSGMWFIDYDESGKRTCVKWSDAFRRMIGYTNEKDFPNSLEAWANLVHPDDLPVAYGQIDKTVYDKTGTKTYNVEYRLKTLNRGYRWFRATGRVSRREDGSPIQFLGIFVDINDAKDLEDMTKEKMQNLEEQIHLRSQLYQEKEHLKMFHDIIHSGMWSMEIDENSRISDVYWSDEFRKLIGFKNDLDFPNTLDSWMSRIHPDDVERTDKDFDEVKHSKDFSRIFDSEFRFQTKSGEYRWFHGSGKLTKNYVNKNNKAFVGTLVDTTEKHTRAQNFQIIEALASEYSSVYYINLDTEEIIPYSMNRVTEDAIGEVFKREISYSKAYEAYVNKLVSEKDREMMMKSGSVSHIRSELKNKKSFNVIYENNRGKYFEMKIVEAGNDKSSLHIALGFADKDDEVREKKSYQESIEEALKKAEAASRAKTTFLSNMSHDIRTPMNAIIGFTSLAKNHADDMEKVQDYLKKIEVSSHHLLSLINDVLDMSRIESGKIQLEEVDCNLQQIMSDLKTIIIGQAQAKQLNVKMDDINIEDEDVVCDKLRLHQVLINILSNAIKFTPVGGDISVSLRQLKKEKDEGLYEFRIKDNGIGMDADFVEKLFEPFERERTSTISKTQGTGLGMSITKNIVDLMGGTINVKSERGKGTEFTVCLSMKTQEKKKECASAISYESASYEFKGKKILLVEDNEFNREIALEVLENEGFVVDCAEYGTVAVDKVKASHEGAYDVILMDIQMPIMDGYEATRQIRKLSNKNLANIPIIAMTANAFEEDKVLAINAGMNEHIAKPIDVYRLKETIRKVVGK